MFVLASLVNLEKNPRWPTGSHLKLAGHLFFPINLKVQYAHTLWLTCSCITSFIIIPSVVFEKYFYHVWTTDHAKKYTIHASINNSVNLRSVYSFREQGQRQTDIELTVD